MYKKSPTINQKSTPNTCTHLQQYGHDTKVTTTCSGFTTVTLCKADTHCAWNQPLCGQEKLLATDRTNKVFNITFNKQQLIKSYDLSTIWKVDTTDLGFPASDCPITSYKLCLDQLCQTNTTEAWYKIQGSTLNVDLSQSIKASKLYLTAVTKGNVISAVPLNINICGDEKISLVNPL